MIGGPTPATGDAGMDRLIGRGGMARMMPTTLIAICAFCFAGIAQKTRMLEVLLRALTKITKTTGQLVLATVGSSILVALMTGNSYLSILIPGELFREAFKARDLAAKNLSRICEDAGTVVVPLVPWSIASVYITGVLNVPTADYAPWAIFCYTGFMFSILYGFTGFAIAPRKREDETQIGS